MVVIGEVVPFAREHDESQPGYLLVIEPEPVAGIAALSSVSCDRPRLYWISECCAGEV
jgi:hypothetical protein